MKALLVVLMLGVLVALASGGFFMLRKGSTPKERDARMARALALRVALSIALFLLIMLRITFNNIIVNLHSTHI